MEYTVILVQQPGVPWRAVAPGLPDCEVEAPTRSEALERIRARIMATVSRIEVLQLQVPVVPKMTNDQPTGIGQTPWQWFGAFQDDSTWGPLFDKIEQQRDAHLAEE